VTAAQENTRPGFDPDAYVQRQRRIAALARLEREAVQLERLTVRAIRGDRHAYARLVRWLGREEAGRAIGQYQTTTRMLKGERIEARDFRRVARMQTALFHRAFQRRATTSILPHRSARTTGRTRCRTRVRTASRTGTGGDADSGGDPDPAPHRVEQRRTCGWLRTPHHIRHHRCLAAAGPNPLGEIARD